MENKKTESNKIAAARAVTPGDTVKVASKYKEGDKDRVQSFQGVVIRVRKGAVAGNFTVRRVTYGIGVERTYFFNSPSVEKVEVLRHGKVRRARLYYLRDLSAKESRLKERREGLALAEGQAEAPAEAPPTENQEP